MEQFMGKNILNFVKELPNDDKCKEYLAKYKWQDGFVCSKCGSTHGCMKKGFKYHCYKCHHVESSTANTLFHKVKFGLQATGECTLSTSSSSNRCYFTFLRLGDT